MDALRIPPKITLLTVSVLFLFALTYKDDELEV